jgi:hypothetical protein
VIAIRLASMADVPALAELRRVSTSEGLLLREHPAGPPSPDGHTERRPEVEGS